MTTRVFFTLVKDFEDPDTGILFEAGAEYQGYASAAGIAIQPGTVSSHEHLIPAVLVKEQHLFMPYEGSVAEK